MRIIAIITSLFIMHPWFVLAATETAGVSATVAKAEFQTSTVSVESQEGSYRLTIDLVNSGYLEAKTVSVFVLFPDVLSYQKGTQQDGTITTQGSTLGQFIEWELQDVAAKSAHQLILTFSPSEITESRIETSFSISIVSPVSIPIIRKVTIGADSDSFGEKPDRLQKFINAYAIRYFSFKRWLAQKLDF